MGDEDTECPTCGRGDFASERGMKIHHKQLHEESIAQQTLVCERCGDEYEALSTLADDSRFCSWECRKNRVEFTCERCGDEYELPPSKAEGRRFCSQKCRRNRVELTCERCSEGYEVIQSEAEDSRFCSQECCKNRVEPTCEQCGEDYEVKQSEAEESRFCSRDCQTDWQSENRTGEDSPTWKGGKETLVCERCGEKYEVKQSAAEESRFCSWGCKKNRVELTCEQCSEGYEVIQSEAEESRFCSRDCQTDWQSEHMSGSQSPQRNGSELQCEYCGDSYYRPQYATNTSRFCSNECQYNWRSESSEFGGSSHPSWKGGGVEVECEVCNNSFEVKPSEVDGTRFCSVECMGRWRSGNVVAENHPQWEPSYKRYYGPNWHKQRSRARHRDQHRCQDCGMTEPKHLAEYGRKHSVHHITPIREFRDGDDLDHEAANDLNNLITLCRSCHSEWEQMTPLRPDTVQPASD